VHGLGEGSPSRCWVDAQAGRIAQHPPTCAWATMSEPNVLGILPQRA